MKRDQGELRKTLSSTVLALVLFVGLVIHQHAKMTARISQLEELGRHLSGALKEQGESVAETQMDLGQLQDFTRAEFKRLQRRTTGSQKEPIMAKAVPDLNELQNFAKREFDKYKDGLTKQIEKEIKANPTLRKLQDFAENQFGNLRPTRP